MADGRRVVWVLGAGFSAALGGPMLRDLLLRKSVGDIVHRYPADRHPELHAPAAAQVRFLYEYGLSNEPLLGYPNVRGERMWSDAEAFLDYLDVAATANAAEEKRVLEGRITSIVCQAFAQNVVESVPVLAAMARRLVAAECCTFLSAAAPESERWRPFRAWARGLGPNDTVVTFNYDRVLETLIAAQNERARAGQSAPSKLKVALPQLDRDRGYDVDRGSFDGCAPVLKLHGSVDWKKVWVPSFGPTGGHAVEVAPDPEHSLRCKPDEILLAMPGPSKERESTQALGPLWRWAEDAIAAADDIILVGYRFPETDAYARERLLAAVAKHKADRRPSHHLNLHVVLGNSTEHARRVRALLHAVAPGELSFSGSSTAEITEHPLFAQDYFSVFPRG